MAIVRKNSDWLVKQRTASLLKHIFTDLKLHIWLWRSLLQCFVWSILPYGSETWTLNAKTTGLLQVAEMWFYRRVLRVPLTARETNKSVLQGTNTKRKLIDIIYERQSKFLGHIMWKASWKNFGVFEAGGDFIQLQWCVEDMCENWASWSALQWQS